MSETIFSTTIFLRFPDRETARAAFALYGSGTAEGPDGAPVWPSCGTYEGYRYDIAVVGADGTIFRPTGATIEADPDLGPMPVLEPVAGFHVNVLWQGPAELIPDFGAARVHPVTPECVFAAA
jgi:hypothetical protein